MQKGLLRIYTIIAGGPWYHLLESPCSHPRLLEGYWFMAMFPRIRWVACDIYSHDKDKVNEEIPHVCPQKNVHRCQAKDPPPNAPTPTEKSRGLLPQRQEAPSERMNELLCPCYGISPVCFKIQMFCATGQSVETPHWVDDIPWMYHLPLEGRHTAMPVSPSPS